MAGPELRAERIDQRVAQVLAATLDLDSDTLEEGAELPPLWHWVYFTPNSLLKFAEMITSTASGSSGRARLLPV